MLLGMMDVALNVQAQHATAPFWDADTGRLWWVDSARSVVHCFEPASGHDDAWPVSEEPGGVVVNREGEPLVATPDGLALLDRRSGALHPSVRARAPGRTRASDVRIDPRGRAWLGTSALDERAPVGALFRIDGDRVTRVVGGLTLTHGPAVDEEARRLYLADTARHVVDYFEFAPRTGVLGVRRRFVDLYEQGLRPAGMALDTDGMLWVAVGADGAVHRYRRDGSLDARIELPTSHPTGVAFGGVDLADLYVTTSWLDASPEHRARQPLAGAVFRCRPGVAGAMIPRFGVARPPTTRTETPAPFTFDERRGR